MIWTEDVITKLRSLWAQGLSTNAIGRRLGASKNAIVGKVHRLGLDARPSPIRAAGAPKAIPSVPRAKHTLPPPPTESLEPVQVALTVVRPHRQALPPLASDVRSIVIQHMREGWSNNRIAQVIGGSEWQMRQIRAEAGIEKLDRRGPAPGTPKAVTPPRFAPRQIQTVFKPSAPGSCCFPIGDVGTKEFRFCDAISLPKCPYCEMHARISYVTVRDRREDAA